MIELKIFDFESNEIRVTKDEDGNPWFVAADLCMALNHSNHSKAIKDHVDDEDVTKRYMVAKNGKNQPFLCVNESGMYSLIFGAKTYNAKKFKKFVTSVILPEIRKHGFFSLENYLLKIPSKWERTFTDEFYSQALRLYNMSYEPAKNPPQFIGRFTNQFVYSALDSKLPEQLKINQDCNSEKEVKALMHQYLNSDAKDILKHHLDTIITLMKISSNIDQFKIQWGKLFERKNQLELYLR